MKKNNVLYLILGQVVSLFCVGIIRYLIIIRVLEISDSGYLFAVLLSCSMIPSIIFVKKIGTFIDTVNKKKIILGLDLLLLFSIIAAMLSFGKYESFWFYLIFITFLTTFSSIMSSTVQAIVPEVTDTNSFAKVNGMVSLINSLSLVLAPIIAGIVYSSIEEINSLLIIPLMIFIGFVIELFIKNKKSYDRIGKSENSINELSYKSILKVAGSLNFVIAPYFILFMPYYLLEIKNLSSNTYGIIEGVFGVGMLCGAIFSGLIIKDVTMKIIVKRIKIIVIFYISLLVTFTIFNQNIYAIVLISFLITAMLTSISVSCITLLQKKYSESDLGAIMIKMNVLSMVVVPLGQLVASVIMNFISIIIYIMFIIITTSIVFYKENINQKKLIFIYE